MWRGMKYFAFFTPSIQVSVNYVENLIVEELYELYKVRRTTQTRCNTKNMSVYALTPLYQVASVNLHRLRTAFEDLESNHDCHSDAGTWFCRTCAGVDACDVDAAKSLEEHCE